MEGENRSAYLWRGGEKLDIAKVPDRFTVRLKRGVRKEDVTRSYSVVHQSSFVRQNLEEFAVDANTCDTAMDQVRKGRETAFASHVYTFGNDPDACFYLTDEITTQFKPDVTDAEVEALTSEWRLSLVKAVEGTPRTYVLRLAFGAKENPIKIANGLVATGNVLLCEPNIVVRSRSCYLPADLLFRQQWHLAHTGGPFLAPGSHIDAERAWDIERGRRSVVVAVIDDSVDVRHRDFQGTGKIVSPRDFRGRDFEPLPEAGDDNHGTACAGVAIAEENGQGVVGVAPGCALMPVRMNNVLDDNAIEELFEWVVSQGASVVSCSWGVDASYFPLSLRQRLALSRAATQGRQGRGCVIVFAAGNSNRPINGTVEEQGWPGNRLKGPTRWLDGFAAHERVIAVAASTSLGKKAAYSNWGAEISVCAPSNNAPPDTYPEVTQPLAGSGIVTTDRVGSSGYSSTDYTSRFGGTSSACPVVAGVAALVLSANPHLTAREVREILETTADKITDPHPDPQLKQSLGQYDVKGHSAWFGYGKVNAFKAVSEAVRQRGGDPMLSIRKVSARRIAIPDNRLEGISDVIQVAEEGTLLSVKVVVDILHTYRGDLRLTLKAPSGVSVILQDRQGGGAKHIKRSFDLTTTPQLSALADASIQGTWTLEVQDLAPADIGELNRWALQIEGRTDTRVTLTESPGVRIPDNDPRGIERALTTAEAGQVGEISIFVDITHTYIQDLSVVLAAPSGKSVALHHRTGGSADNIMTTFSRVTTPGLDALQGEALSGIWTLKVADLEGQDIGKLNRWAVHVTRART